MRGYERISEGSSRGEKNGQDVREEGGVGSLLHGPGEQAQGGETRRRKLTSLSLGVIAVVGVILGISGLRQQQKQQQHDSAAADFGSRNAGVAVSVFETSMRTGAKLSQSFPSPAGLMEDCNSAEDSDDSGSSSSSDSDDDDGLTVKLCPKKGGWGTVVVQSEEKRQEIIGFGGAFTDAAYINFFKLPKDVQEKVLDMYFGPDGIEYSVGRVPMGSCDFSVESYSFADVPGDYNLTHFDDGVERDSAQRIPMIQSALKRRKDLKIFTSPWSPPAWMKEPLDGVQSMVKSASPEGLLPDPRVHAAWALFFSRFISAYKEQGVDMWGLTIQNESENKGPWEACVYTPFSQANFIRDHLGPIMRRDHPDVKIMAFDHNRDHLLPWAVEMMRDEETSQYVDGMAFHWYFATGDRLMDGSQGWGALNMTQDVLGESKFILSTESCNCPNAEHSMEGGWKRAEHVAHDMIADVNSWSTGWVDWNLMLDYDGGPNHLGNLCDSPVIANEDHTEVIFQPMFYYMGHITKFAQPGARLLKSHVTGVYQDGGGRPAEAVPGYEATMYACEGSVRQTWELSAAGKITLADYYGAEYDWYSPLCLSRKLVKNMKAVFLVLCDSPEAATFKHDPESGRLVLQPDTSPPDAAVPTVEPTTPLTPAPANEPVEGSEPPTPAETPAPAEETCLDVLNGSTDDGAVLTLTPCVPDDAPEGSGGEYQKWSFSEVEGGAGEGSFTSVPTGRCVTAGWPFFTGAAFEMSEASKVRYGKDYSVVLLNEAEEPVEFDLSFPSEGFTVKAIIGPRSIQTVLA